MKTYLSILIVLLSINDSFAQANEHFKYQLNGFVELDHISFFKNMPNKINSRNQSTLQLNLTSSLHENYNFNSSIEFRNDLSDSQRNRVLLKESYLDFVFSNWDLRVGKQIISWGKADVFNPTNNINPIDYSDILDTENERIGIWCTNLRFSWLGLNFQTLFAPVFSETIFPQDNSRWLHIPTEIQMNGKDYKVKYNLKNLHIPEKNISNSQYAIKLEKNIRNLDLSLSYYYGQNDIPESIQKIVSIQNDSITIDSHRLYHKYHVVGLDFAYVLGKNIIKGEGAYFVPTKASNNYPYFQYVVGIERSFLNIIEDNSLHLMFQWIHEIKNSNTSYDFNDFNHLFKRNLQGRMKFDIGHYTSISLQGIYNFLEKDFYIQPEIAHSISDGLNLVVKADILNGKNGGFFYQFRENNRIQAKLKYDF